MGQVTKNIVKYNRDIGWVELVEVKQHDYRGYMRNKTASERFKIFDAGDFQDASVLDVGCSHGHMLCEARNAGATRTVGLEYNEVAAKHAAELDHAVYCDDVENPCWWRRWGENCFDVVMVLAVWKTSRFSERKAILAQAARVSKNVMYWETHRDESPVEVARDVLFYTDFTTIECRVSGEARHLLRCSYRTPSFEGPRMTDGWVEFGPFEVLLCRPSQKPVVS